jgi:restriction endonuclease S subunit
MSNTASISLSSLADIKAGYPFREAIESSDNGVPVLRIKDLRPDGPINWSKVIRSELTGRRADWLEDGDILFVARGAHSHAYCLSGVPEQAVCSPHFFQIHLKSNSGLLPEFLAWQINQKPAQDYFDSSAEGSTIIRNIRRQVLGDLQVVVPTIEKQQQVLRFHEAMLKEKYILQSMITNTDRIMNAVANDLLRKQK